MSSGRWKITDDVTSRKKKKIQSASYKHGKDFLSFHPNAFHVFPLKSLDGQTTIKDPEGIVWRYTEYFTKLLFNPSTFDDPAIDNFPQNHLLHLSNVQDVNLESKQINIGKAHELEGIAVELLRFRGYCVALPIFNLITLIWEDTTLPQD